jgi:hypothetical protein
VADLMPRPLRTLAGFVRHILYRDKYLTEVLASLVTFAVGVLASFSQPALEVREVMAGFRDLPMPELWIMLMTLPGTWHALRYAVRPQIAHRWMGLIVMACFWALCCFSLAIELNNWAFWTLLALLLGVMQGVAVVSELRDLRWGCALIGSFFWVTFAASVTAHSPSPWPLGIATYWGWAAANLLSVSRLSVKV